MKVYDSYKPILLPWLTYIPAHWDLQRNKNIFRECKAEVGDNSDQYTLLSLSLKGIIPRDMDGGGKFPASFDKYKIVKKGNMAFCLFDIDETPRTVGLSEFDGMLTGAYTIMEVSNINSMYAYYYYLSLDNVKALKPLYTGLRKTISIDKFQGTKLPVPPEDEQEQIVRFLNWKVSAINRLINQYRQEIKSLSTLKTRIIDDTTIKGLSHTELSHNEDERWNIDYPAHWNIQRMRECFKFRKGLSITKANLEESGVPVISYGQVHSKKNSGVGICDELIRFVNPSYLNANASSLVKLHDFIFADTSEDVEGCGNCVFIDRDDTIFAGYHSVIAHPELSGNIKYLAYLFQSPTWRYQIRKKVNAVKVYSITQKILKDAFILLPPSDEQDEIVEYLDGRCRSIDSFIAKIEEKIQQLLAMKMTMISDVVTGKIDVRNVEIPEYEFMADVADSDTEDDIEEENQEEEE